MSKILIVFILGAALGCGGSKAVPVSIMQRWIGEPFKKVMADNTWKKKHFKQEVWNGNGSVHYFADKGDIPPLSSDNVEDKLTGVTYKGPAGVTGNKFFIVNKFYVDADSIIREWEIVQTSIASHR